MPASLAQRTPVTDPRLRAEAEQRRASDPAVSVFVSASAGSGKTKLLTDRLLRLMLDGAAPERILCLTFTKAAAAEMALRLRRRLGEWVTLPDAQLDAELSALQVPASAEARLAARALFARVLDLPGGMRIGTIHAFCQSLLRRFPLEAALPPHFQLVDPADAALALDEARETMLAGADAALRAWLTPLAGLVGAGDFGGLVAALAAGAARHGDALARIARQAPEAIEARLRRALGVEAPNEAALMAGAVSAVDPALAPALRLAAEAKSASVRNQALAMLDWLSGATDARVAGWEAWSGWLFTDAGKPRALRDKKLLEAHPEIVEAFAAECRRVAAIEDARRALAAARATAALLALSAPVLADYRARKQGRGLLDYEDLIAHTNGLLRDPGAAWVLYKLDGGLDHLLLDEVQDTSDPQWHIAFALVEEFFGGIAERPRTFFAVGDPKQSIYSFQGADPDAFERWRTRLRARAAAAALPWADVPLDVSFRSTPPVLALVDAVFADPLSKPGVVPPNETLRHYPNRAGQAGRVEIWPLAPPPEEEAPEPWTVPTENLGLRSAPQALAEALADWIAGQTNSDARPGQGGRAPAPGDILVLVRRRGQFDRALLRALKARGVPVAGLDRMHLADQPAVQDLLALLDVLLLPEDDLRLAELLVSPLGGLTDDSLMALAMERDGERPGSLWDALRRRAAERPDWRAALDFVSHLRGRADYATPHALLTEALGALGGRARLFARLGPEAADPVDELLAAALRHAALHPPSLQGFLHWLRRSGAEVKREAESGGPQAGGGQVRIMTVHGAKGLQAPLVILPDTTALPPDDGPLVWTDAEDGTLPLWSPRKELRCKVVDEARAAREARRLEEHNRLLYVALTRAEDRLVICGWQPRKSSAVVDDRSWYRMVQRGFEALPTTEHPFAGGWGGTALAHEQTGSPRHVPPAEAAAPTPAVPPPGWMGRAENWRAEPPPAEPGLPRPLAPSRPDGVETGPVPRAASPRAPEARRQAGILAHALLQHLPALPGPEREPALRRYLAGHELPPEQADVLAAQLLAALRRPDLAPLFAPGSRAEVPLSGVVGGRVVEGVVDRLAVHADGVWLADYKTGRDPPETAGETPVSYLRQMAAYRAVLRLVFPGRLVRAVLIWTQGARPFILPDTLLDQHAPDRAQTAEPHA